LFQVTDFVTPLVPLGLGLGRLGNFANTELPGRMTDSAFGLIYPCNAEAIRQLHPLCVGQWETFARHPSPLYQAFAEGLVLFTLIWWFSARPRPAAAVSGLFLVAYGVLRFVTELFRTPDAHLGFIALDWLTMGQLLSIPMIFVGILLLVAPAWIPGLPGRRSDGKPG
jgi:phosphatidylglycerol:prolipoprotein diacylglycerol transferase